MFDTPFRYGQAWSATEDEQRARIAVIGAELNDLLFHGENSVGRTIRANGADMRIVGVLKPWRPVPHSYDLNTTNYGAAEQVFVPLTTSRAMRLTRNGGASNAGA